MGVLKRIPSLSNAITLAMKSFKSSIIFGNLEFKNMKKERFCLSSFSLAVRKIYKKVVIINYYPYSYCIPIELKERA